MKLLRSVVFGRVMFLVGLLAFAGPARAGLLASSTVVYDEGLGDGSVTVLGALLNGGGTSQVGYNSAVVPGIATAGSASAAYGALHASAFSAVANPGAGLTSQTRAQGVSFWSDQLTFSSATLTGTAFARATFSLSGALNSLSAPGTAGNSTIAAGIRVNGSQVFATTGQLVSQGGAITIDDIQRGQGVNGIFNLEPASDLAGSFFFDIPFEFGVAFQMTGELTAFTQALSGAPGNPGTSAHSDFGSSGLWKGISEIHLSNGTVLRDYALQSASGFDWTGAFPSGPVEAVPEPATVWLFGVGLLGLLGAARRREKA